MESVSESNLEVCFIVAHDRIRSGSFHSPEHRVIWAQTCTRRRNHCWIPHTKLCQVLSNYGGVHSTRIWIVHMPHMRIFNSSPIFNAFGAKLSPSMISPNKLIIIYLILIWDKCKFVSTLLFCFEFITLFVARSALLFDLIQLTHSHSTRINVHARCPQYWRKPKPTAFHVDLLRAWSIDFSQSHMAILHIYGFRVLFRALHSFLRPKPLCVRAVRISNAITSFYCRAKNYNLFEFEWKRECEEIGRSNYKI